MQYVKNLRRDSLATWSASAFPNTSSVTGGENVLHNQSSLRLKGRPLFEPGVMVTSVPWQLRSTTRRDLQRGRPLPDGRRRGVTTQRRS
ncbi:hypothetical protein MUY14_05150 [Amycolatopsis sp. FBCC-B4732]|uniref:hypothetical protein n=1 Tax=Amycolatopsis sp. FBCC-B4732 TaxID=3079339 RepID=UPI001FF6F836|nr:hypothetical protein [Amycolatopsis sp. FBCC-B4732]UOX90026.1 hypothetical protein MUY14_05150 [Amycolatopsis sp. FBCC-B4732]